MPDWSYRTVFQPVLFALPVRVARDLALRAMGTLARAPGGSWLIDFLGHMRADRRLERTIAGVTFASPVGLGGRLDPELEALGALARFGFGFLEVGPVLARPTTVPDASSELQRRIGEQAIVFRNRTAGIDAAQCQERLAAWSAISTPVLIRLTVVDEADPQRATDECVQLIEQLGPRVHLFAIDTTRAAISGTWSNAAWQEHCRQLVMGSAQLSARPLLLSVAADCNPATAVALARAAIEAGFAGVQINGEVAEQTTGVVIGGPARAQTLSLTQRLRSDLSAETLIIAAGGVHEPIDVLALLEHGANLVQIDSGLVYSGPGLVKRANDAVLWAEASPTSPSPEPPQRLVETDWLWAFLMGLGMFIGGLMAIIIASTRVVLPYDEDFACMTLEQLHKLNERLLPFMCHDRVSLSGTMLSIGVIYISLAGIGMRRGLHWARIAVLASAFVGFASFFLFLGFGYFDPFHAFVTLVLLQFLLLAVHGKSNAVALPTFPNLRDDWQWRLSQWGQLLLIAHGAALVVAGATISFLGATTVFVPEDLKFLQTSADLLIAANPKLVPLVAHDRASFGGMILACGVATLLAALWGFQQGRRWLWWMLAIAGAVAYAPAIAVHYAVGYINTWHLAPAYSGLAVLSAGLLLSYPYLCVYRKDADPCGD